MSATSGMAEAAGRLQISHELVDGRLDVLAGRGGQVKVADGGSNASVAEESLDGAHIEALLKQVGGVGVAEGMASDGFVDVAVVCGGLDALADGLAADGLGAGAVGEQPGLGMVSSPVGTQQVEVYWFSGNWTLDDWG